VNARIRLLTNTSAKDREDGSVFLETSYNSKILWRDEKLTKDGTRVDERRFIVQRALTYLKHDMVQIYIIQYQMSLSICLPLTGCITDMFFSPININKTHWYAGILNARKRKIQVLDSLGYELGVQDLQKVVSYCITTSSYSYCIYYLSQKHSTVSKQVQGLEKQFDILIELRLYKDYQKWKDTKVTEWTWTFPIKSKMQFDRYISTLSFLNIYIYKKCMIYDPHLQYSMLSDHAAYHVAYSCSSSLNFGQEIDYLRFSLRCFNIK
jgi:hypothetical protein